METSRISLSLAAWILIAGLASANPVIEEVAGTAPLPSGVVFQGTQPQTLPAPMPSASVPMANQSAPTFDAAPGAGCASCQQAGLAAHGRTQTCSRGGCDLKQLWAFLTYRPLPTPKKCCVSLMPHMYCSPPIHDFMQNRYPGGVGCEPRMVNNGGCATGGCANGSCAK